jgi:hypothetical protein
MRYLFQKGVDQQHTERVVLVQRCGMQSRQSSQNTSIECKHTLARIEFQDCRQRCSNWGSDAGWLPAETRARSPMCSYFTFVT